MKTLKTFFDWVIWINSTSVWLMQLNWIHYGRHGEIVSINVISVETIGHLSNKAKSTMRIQVDKFYHFISHDCDVHFNGHIFSSGSRYCSRLRSNILCCLLSIRFHDLFSDIYVENGKRFGIDWMLRRIYSKKWVTCEKCYESKISQRRFYPTAFFKMKIVLTVLTINLTTESWNLLLLLKYHNLNVKIERMSGILHSLATKVSTVGIIMPSVLTTTYNYFILNLGHESYYLSYPLWFVWIDIDC